MGTIVCNICKITKPISEYYVDKRRVQVNPRCKTCHRQMCTARNRETADIPKYRYRELEHSAKRRGINVEITQEQHMEILGSRICFYCDANFSKDRGSGLNRCDSSKGYVVGNLKPCCGTCNTLMSNFTVEQLRARLIKIYKRLTKGDPIK